MSKGTIIIGSLDDKELMSAINKLAKDINAKMGDESSGKSTVVGAFASGIKAMEDRLVKFNQNAGKTVESIKKTFTELGVTYDELAKAMQKAANIDLSALEAKRAKAGARDVQGKPATNFELEQLNAYYRELERVSALEAKRAKNEETLRRRGYADRLTAYGRMPEGDLTNAEEKLRKLLALKNDLRRDPLLSLSQMQQLDNRIQKTISKVRELRAVLASSQTPTMGGVMGMSEKTLDEIARKMQAIRGLRSGLNYQTQAGDINRLNAEYTRLNQLQNQILGQNLRIESSNNALARSFGYIRNRIVYALTLGAATSFVKQLYDIRGQYELLERSLGVLTNSFQKGRQIFQELNEMAIKSPFTLVELAGAAKQLTAYNFSANEVVDTTRRLADISAALGVPMERLTYNLGQIRAQTVLTARDARDFANAGLPMVKSLADYYSELEGRVVSTGDVYERMSKKMVSYSDVMAVINKMTDEGGKFFDFQAKQADTLKVQIANLSLAWNNMLNEMGESNQDFLALPIKSVRALFQNWKEINRILTDVAVVIGVVKAAQIALNLVYGKGNAAIKSQILLSKQKRAIDLDKKALTEQLTVSEERLRVTRNSLTAADYRATLAGRNLTKQQALLMVSLDRSNMALKKALVQLNILTAAEIRSANAGTVLKTAFQSLGLTLKGLGATLLSSLPMLAVTAAIGGIVHLVQQYSDNAERLKEMNESLAESAKESADSLEKFLSNAGNKTTKELAKDSLLTGEQGAKAWESMSEEIKNSAASAESLLFTLAEMKRDGKDINAIITEGFEKLESIRDVQEALQDLDKSGIKVSQTLFGGLFGKGLGDAAEDFNDKIKNFKGSVEDVNNILSTNTKYTTDLGQSYAKFGNELAKTTQSIADYIKAQNITDPAKITEIIEQARKAIKSKTPQLKGDIAKMFDIEYDKQLAEKLKMPVIETASMWNVFMTELKKHRSEFGNLTDEIYTDSAKLNKQEQQAIMATLENIKKNFPQYYKDIQNIIDNDKPSLYLHVGLTLGVQERNDIQKMFDEDFPEVKFNFARPQAAEKDLMSYGKRVTETIKSNEEALEKAEKQLEAIPIVQDELYQNQLKYINSLKSKNEILTFIRDTWHLLNFEKDKAGGGGSKKDILGDAIKDELRIITDMQKGYKEYMKIGVGSTEAMNKAVSEYGSTLEKVNKILAQYGFMTLQPQQIAKMPLQEIRDFYANQLDVAKIKDSVNAIEALEKAIATINVEITKDNYKTIIEGLNSELSKVKDEYELGVELDASPELGQAFADIFKIDIDQLPRTVYDAFRHVEHAVQGALSSLGIKDSFNVMTDSLEDFAKKYERDLGSDFISAIKKIQETIRGMWKKETSDTIKDWNNLLDKYGDFQTKLMKISKDSAQEQLSIIKRFGSTEDKSEAQIIVDNISISQDPAQIEVLRKQLLDILNKVVTDKDVAIKIKTASSKEESSLISKAYWEDFKNSELYSMTFEDMDRVSTRAIKDILAQLDILKDKVKEDPASMKALMDAEKKVRDELEKRSPFMAIGESLKEWAEASKEVKAANEAYTASIKEMNDAEEEYQAILERNKMLQSMGEYGVSAEDLEETAEAQEKLNKAKEKAGKSKENLTGAENKEISAQTKFQSALKNSASALQSMGGALSTVTELMGVAEDSELGVMVNSLIGGFQTMATVLGVVATMAELVQLSFGWIGIVMVALSALIGVLTYVSKLKEMAINKSIEISEFKVKRLELAYKNLEYAIEDAYGTARIESQRALKANKELQLAELKRQLQLERSRDSKKLDEDKIIDLTGQIDDLEHEISRITKDAVNDLLGISSVGDAAEGLMSSFIEALRNGEDAMTSFNDSIDDMIANMVMKLFSTKILMPWFDKAVKQIEDRVTERSKEDEKAYKNAVLEYEDAKRNVEKGGDWGALAWAYNDKDVAEYWLKQTGGNLQESYLAYYKDKMDKAYKAYLESSEITLDDIIVGAEYLRETQGAVEESQDELRDALERLGLIKSQTSQNLSNLQQGITQISEDTASAIQSYLNGISQQVYLENSQLAEIKEYISNFNFDIQLGVLSEILLQLQTSYQTQNAIQSILQGWSNANGMAVRVELQ